MLKMPWTTKRSNKAVLKERQAIRFWKRQSIFIEHMRAGGLEYPVTTGIMEGKRDT